MLTSACWPGGDSVAPIDPPPPPPIATFTLSPDTRSIVVGDILRLVAAIKDSTGEILCCMSIVWATDSASVARVDGTGIVTGVAVGGPVRITAATGGRSATSTITVTR